MAKIAFQAVTKVYPGTDRCAVDQVSMSVAEGEFCVLLGPSGCGKTTLMKMVNRLFDPTSGQILVDGKDVRSVEPVEHRRRIGYVIQSTGLFPHMTVAENIAVVPNLLGWDRQRIATRVDEVLDLIGLAPAMFRSRWPRQLSGGQAQRVGVARALAADPSILLMDEPFSAIDAITRTQLQDELLRIQRKLHKTILFVTHDVDEALKLADRIAVMRAGRLVQYGPPAEVVGRPEDEFVAQLVGGDDILRHMSVILIRHAMDSDAGRAGAGRPTIGLDQDLKAALSLMLQHGVDQLQVVDAAGAPAGTLHLDSLRRLMRRSEQPAGAGV